VARFTSAVAIRQYRTIAFFCSQFREVFTVPKNVLEELLATISAGSVFGPDVMGNSCFSLPARAKTKFVA
jgi:hypothetical protein